MKNIIIITGASSGIGLEFLFEIDKAFSNIDEIWMIARSAEKLELCSVLATNHAVRLFPMDITEEAQLDLLTEAVKTHDAVVRMLINCAGFGVMGPFDTQRYGDAVGMVRLNCEALTAITHRMLPFMKRGSRIIQMASSAAFLPQIDFAVYAATKSYVLSFSRALGEELKSRGIYVTAVCPGPVDTPFFDRAEEFGSTLAVKKYTMVKAPDVVRKALRDSYHKLPVSVYSIPIIAFFGIAKFVPHDICLGIMRMLKKREN